MIKTTTLQWVRCQLVQEMKECCPVYSKSSEKSMKFVDEYFSERVQTEQCVHVQHSFNYMSFVL